MRTKPNTENGVLLNSTRKVVPKYKGLIINSIETYFLGSVRKQYTSCIDLIQSDLIGFTPNWFMFSKPPYGDRFGIWLFESL